MTHMDSLFVSEKTPNKPLHATALRNARVSGSVRPQSQNMKSLERNRDLTFPLEREGARAGAVLERCRTRSVASRPRSASSSSVTSAAIRRRSLVASFGAALRSASRHERCGASTSVFSVNALLPNNTLVLTAQRQAPLGSRSASAAPAAQRHR